MAVPLSRLAEAMARVGLLEPDAVEQLAATCLEVLAGVVGARGQPELAAQLIGAADALYGPAARWGAAGRLHPVPAVDRIGRGGGGRHGSVARWAEAGAAAGGRRAAGATEGPPPGLPPPSGSRWRGTSRPSSDDPLTSREREVAVLLARGLSNKEIAQALVIAERTAETHVTHILTKLNLVSRVQVGPWAAAHGLRPTEPS